MKSMKKKTIIGISTQDLSFANANIVRTLNLKLNLVQFQ